MLFFQVVHTKLQPFSCPVCKKPFNQISNMKRHMKIHSDRRPYKCKYCGDRFKYINSWRYHEGIHTGNVFICEKCGFQCRSRKTMKNHVCDPKTKVTWDATVEKTQEEIDSVAEEMKRSSKIPKPSSARQATERLLKKSLHIAKNMVSKKHAASMVEKVKKTCKPMVIKITRETFDSQFATRILQAESENDNNRNKEMEQRHYNDCYSDSDVPSEPDVHIAAEVRNIEVPIVTAIHNAAEVNGHVQILPIVNGPLQNLWGISDKESENTVQITVSEIPEVTNVQNDPVEQADAQQYVNETSYVTVKQDKAEIALPYVLNETADLTIKQDDSEAYVLNEASEIPLYQDKSQLYDLNETTKIPQKENNVVKVNVPETPEKATDKDFVVVQLEPRENSDNEMNDSGTNSTEDSTAEIIVTKHTKDDGILENGSSEHIMMQVDTFDEPILQKSEELVSAEPRKDDTFL